MDCLMSTYYGLKIRLVRDPDDANNSNQIDFGCNLTGS